MSWLPNTKVVLREGEPRLGTRRVLRDGKFDSANLLAADGLNRLELEVEIGFEVQFHRKLTGRSYASISRSPLGSGIGSPNSFAVSIQSSIA